jgi:phosphoribosylaminoimidazolecarboxamide formyltransferase/IMP cyclohydrolase
MTDAPPGPAAAPLPVRRALLSVTDKTGLGAFAAGLVARGARLVSTGGTAAALRAEGLAVEDVAAVTGFPEMLDGRVKTLHPAIHGGLLANRADPAHMAALAARGIAPIDLLAVNLYAFEATVAAGADFGAAVEAIDIGGPAMIRAAAKNHAGVAVATDPADYPAILADLDAQGGVGAALRRRLAAEAFARTAAYDAAISGWLAAEAGLAAPRGRAVGGRLVEALRYGENPHQGAAFYAGGPARPGVAQARQVQGKALSYNNILDADAAWEAVAEFARPEFGGRAACVIVKHANPCGVALGDSPAAAWRAAFDADRTSAFGGIVALNRPLDRETAEAVGAIFTEVIVAPDAAPEALAVLAAKPNLRLLLAPLPDPAAPGLAFRQVAGGFLAQDRDAALFADWRVVTRRAPTPAEAAGLRFAWAVAKHVKSNAIVFARGEATVGVGAGQMSRLDSTRIAARKAADMAATLGLAASPAQGAAVASDAFFPFADGLEACAEAGATAIVQPGGSVRDAEVIAAADARGLAMVFTGMRHFRH